MSGDAGDTKIFGSVTGEKTKDEDPWGIGAFIFGCILIPFSLVLLWKNEKKVVTYAKCIDQGREKVKTVECDDPDEVNELELVHTTGVAVNKEIITDPDFGIDASDSYRLKRKIEMYQYRERVSERDGRKHYTYEGIWSE